MSVFFFCLFFLNTPNRKDWVAVWRLLHPENPAARPRLSQDERSTYEGVKVCKGPAARQAWRHIPVFPALGRGKQEDEEFKVILGYEVNLKLA